MTTDSIISAKEIVSGGLVRPTSTQTRFDPSEVSSHIADAEMRYLRNALGIVFYNRLIKEKATDDSNYNIALGALVPKFTDADLEKLYTLHLQKLCAYCTHSEALPFISAKTATQGVMLNNTEFATNKADDWLSVLLSNLTRKINPRLDDLKKYLCENKAKFEPFGYDGSKCENCSSQNLNINQDNYSGIIFH